MFVVYILIYPCCAIVLAFLAVHLFPFPIAEPHAQALPFGFYIFPLVDYLLTLFLLLFCFMLLRRIFRRSLFFFMQLPLPIWGWGRIKHLIPAIFSLAVLLYLFMHLLLHTVVGIGLAVLWEWMTPVRMRSLSLERIRVLGDAEDRG